MVTSIYILADTIIIGKGIGIHAMAALNIVLPLFNIFFGNGLLRGCMLGIVFVYLLAPLFGVMHSLGVHPAQ